MVNEKEYAGETPALQWVSSSVIPAMAEFRTRDYFPIEEYKPNSHDMTWEPKSPWIAHLSREFRHRFGGVPRRDIPERDVPELVERNILEFTLNGYAVTRSISDASALEVLGGAEKVAVPLYAVYATMEQQKDGQGGVLPVRNCGSFFLCKDATGVFCRVFARYQSFENTQDALKEKYRGWCLSVVDISEQTHLYDTEGGGGHFLFTGARIS